MLSLYSALQRVQWVASREQIWPIAVLGTYCACSLYAQCVHACMTVLFKKETTVCTL